MFLKIKSKIIEKMEELVYMDSLNVAASIGNRDTFLKFKDCNKGKQVVLCGAGPTFADYTPILNASHIALNRALLNKRIKFDWFIADDWEGIVFFQNEIINYNCVKFIGSQIGGESSKIIPESFCRECGGLRYYNDSYFRRNSYKGKFVFDIDRRPIAGAVNIALSAMQIVLYSNPDKIYLVGCDVSSGHYIAGRGANEQLIEKQERELRDMHSGNAIIEKWIELKEFASTYYPNTEIISINPVGLKGIFKDEYQQ